MEFLKSQESLTAIQWMLRAIVAFFFLLLLTKIMGQRSISQLRLLDFMMALSIGNIISHPLSDENLGLKGSIITMIVIVSLYVGGVIVSLKWSVARKFLEPSPFPLIKNGKIIHSALFKARISLDLLLSELRKEKVDDVQKVSLALWEPGGTISIFLDAQYKTITPVDLKIVVKPFSYPIPIIKERKIDLNALKQIGKNEHWLKMKINKVYSTQINDILLATINQKNEIKIYLYE